MYAIISKNPLILNPEKSRYIKEGRALSLAYNKVNSLGNLLFPLVCPIKLIPGGSLLYKAKSYYNYREYEG